jgi:peptidoglycan/xylan/chitin deacetylase (PgdA/CDA1 family)
VERLARRYSLVPLRDLVQRLSLGTLRPGEAAITFDDGYAGVYEHAFPVLRRMGLPATIFVVTRYADSGGAFWWDRLAWHLSRRAGRRLALPPALGGRAVRLDPPRRLWGIQADLQRRLGRMEGAARDRLLDALGAEAPPYSRPLGWSQIEEMRRHGFAVEAHTHAHPFLTGLPGDALREELAISRDRIADRLGGAPSLFAYPFGDAGPREARAVRAAGFSAAFTTEPARCACGSPPYRLPRLLVGNWDEAALESRLEALRGPAGVAARAYAHLKMSVPAAVAVRVRGVRRALAPRRGAPAGGDAGRPGPGEA